MGRPRKYKNDEERLESARIRQREYYNRIKKDPTYSANGKKLGRPSKKESDLEALNKLSKANDNDLATAVREFCCSCMGFDTLAVKYCKDTSCQLYQFRLGLDWSGTNGES